MRMADAIFLSAGVPDPERSLRYATDADPVAIAAAVSALVYVTLGRRPLVWGGHPAITPMVWTVADEFGLAYGEWVQLYQTKFFKDEYPDDLKRFNNVTFTPAANGDREKSLRQMREHMLRDHQFKAAVFIGGMEGTVQEFELFKEYQPNATVLPIASTGGAAIDVAAKAGHARSDLIEDLDYVRVFYNSLGISAMEQRYERPSLQPLSIEQRLRRPPQRSAGEVV